MILVQVNISYQFKGFAIQYRINCPFVTAILTKQGKKKKPMSRLKYPNKNE